MPVWQENGLCFCEKFVWSRGGEGRLTHLVYFRASLCSCFSVSWGSHSSPFSELSGSEAKEDDLVARSIDPSDGNCKEIILNNNNHLKCRTHLCDRGGGVGWSDTQHTVGVTVAIRILRFQTLGLLHHHIQDHNGRLQLFGGNKKRNRKCRTNQKI